MLALLKARLRDPRTWGVVCYVAALLATYKIAPLFGIRGEELKELLLGGGAFGTVAAYLLKTPKDADAHRAKQAQPSGDSGEPEEDPS